MHIRDHTGEIALRAKTLEQRTSFALAVRQFLKIVTVLDWDNDAANQYADIRHQLTLDGL